MKKTKIILLSALVTLALFATVTGCKRSDNTRYGDASFWNNNINKDITVIVDDIYYKDITTLDYGQFCNQAGLANFPSLTEGYHTYRAHTYDYTVTWPETSFYVEGDYCNLTRL